MGIFKSIIDFFSYKNINPQEVSKLRLELGLDSDDFVLSYLGSLGTWYMLNEMLDFFKVLKTKRPNAKFLFITPDEPEFVVNAAVVKGIDGKDIIVKRAKRNEVPIYCSLSNVSIFFILPKYSKRASWFSLSEQNFDWRHLHTRNSLAKE